MNQLELLKKLRDLDELSLVEVLGVTSDDIVDAFLDRISEKEEELEEQVRDIVLNGFEEE